jgi:uncharacterized caspase-like protein/WD40 repeat protein
MRNTAALLATSLAFCGGQVAGTDAPQRAAPALVSQLGHAGAVASATLSPDGRLVVTGGRDGTVRLWHAETGHELRRLVEPSTRRPWQHVVAEFSPDGARVVFASRDVVGVLDLSDGRLLWTIPMILAMSPTFSADGETVQVCHGVVDEEGDGHAEIALLAADNGASTAAIPIPGRALGGHGNLVCAWSPDRRLVAVGFYAPTADTAIGVWDVVERGQVSHHVGLPDAAHALRFSPSARRLLAVDAGHRLYVWERSSARVPPALASNVVDATFLEVDDELGMILQASPNWSQQWGTLRQFDSRLVRWSLHRAAAIQEVPYVSSLPGVPMSVSGGVLLTGYNTTVDHWQVASWQKTGTLSNSELGKIVALQVSADERLLLVVYEGDPRRPRGFLLDLERGEIVRETSSDAGARFALDRSGRYVVEGDAATAPFSGDVLTSSPLPAGDPQSTRDGLVLLATNEALSYWDPFTSAHRWRWSPRVPAREEATGESPVTPVPILRAAVSPARDLVATAGGVRHHFQLWDGNGRFLRALEQSGPARGVEFSADGTRLLTCGWDATIWDVPAGKLWRRYARGLVTSARFTDAGSSVLLTLYDGSVVQWDAERDEEVHRFPAHIGSATSAVMLNRRGLLISGGSDKLLRLSDLKSGRDPVTLGIRNREQWTAVDALGRFDGSLATSETFVWVVGDEPIELDQLRSRYYQPHLLAKFLTRDPDLRNVPLFSAPALFPLVETRAPTREEPRLEIVLTDRGGGIGEVPVYLNGQELAADARRLAENQGSQVVDGTLRLWVDVRGDGRLRPSGKNVIAVHAFERENYLRSRPRGEALFSEAAVEHADPRLRAVVVGVSDYDGADIDLRYAAKDAEDFARALRIAGDRMLGPGRTTITVLSSGAASAQLEPTARNIKTALDTLRKSAHTDVVVVYFAGHGVTLGNESGDYYFLAADASSFGLADAEVRRRVAISGNELAEIMKLIPAEKRAMILDTCGAGRFLQEFGTSRYPPDDEARALHRLHERTGFHILAGAAAGKPSWEASPYSQGLLTYSLLFGMRGAALDADRYVDVVRLFELAAQKVPQLARRILGVQRPLFASPGGGTSFAIGRVLPRDAAEIPLESERAVFVRARLDHATLYRDPLRLSAEIDARLRTIAEPDHTGRSPIVFVDAEEYPRAIEITGRYDESLLSAIVYRGEEELKRFAIPIEKASPARALDALLRQVLDLVDAWREPEGE